MKPEHREQPARAVSSLACPHCGTELSAELLVLDDAGKEAVLVLDCPTGDFHLAVTEKDVNNALATEVIVRLRRKRTAA